VIGNTVRVLVEATPSVKILRGELPQPTTPLPGNGTKAA
jgi:hypothetical protein